jgi:hypothetical protein
MFSLKKYISLILIFSFSSCVNIESNSCTSYWLNGLPSYSFEIPLEINLEKEVISIGDTLFISIEMNDSIKDLSPISKSHKKKIKKFPLFIKPFIGKLNDDYNYSPSVSDQNKNLLLLNGDSISNNRKVYLTYEENKYFLNLAFIPKTKGLYLVDLPNVNLGTNFFPWLCKSQRAEGLVKIKDNKKNNNIVNKYLKKYLNKNYSLKESKYSEAYSIIALDDTININYVGFNYAFEVN